jgi:hypothetical protein
VFATGRGTTDDPQFNDGESLPDHPQARPVWDRAAEMILMTAKTGKAADLQEATRQVLVSLEHENWVKD